MAKLLRLILGQSGTNSNFNFLADTLNHLKLLLTSDTTQKISFKNVQRGVFTCHIFKLLFLQSLISDW